MKKLLTILIIIVMALSVTGCGGENVEAIDPESLDYVTVEIVPGSTGTSIGQQLADAGIIADGDDFRKYLKKNELDAKLQAGVYSFSANMDYATIADILTTGKVATKTFTIPEGLTIIQTVSKLVDQGMGDYDKFMDIIKHGDFSDYAWLQYSIENNGYDRLEGYLLPNTYTVPINYTEQDIINVLIEQYPNYVFPLVGDINLASFNNIIVKASIIERECKKDEERPLVASVINNRLEKGMLLQMDSTLNYLFLQETGEVKETVLYSDLEKDSPYNTYKYSGLPPHPICNPGLASIEAAINPADTDYLYFVVSGDLDGSTRFSTNATDFAKDVRDYDKALTQKHAEEAQNQ